jgi:hypothetical protein
VFALDIRCLRHVQNRVLLSPHKGGKRKVPIVDPPSLSNPPDFHPVDKAFASAQPLQTSMRPSSQSIPMVIEGRQNLVD